MGLIVAYGLVSGNRAAHWTGAASPGGVEPGEG